MHQFFTGINKAFDDHNHLLTESISDTDRKLVLDQLGEAGSAYRNTIYSKGFSGNKETLSKEALQSCMVVAKNFLEHSIRANERQDTPTPGAIRLLAVILARDERDGHD